MLEAQRQAPGAPKTTHAPYPSVNGLSTAGATGQPIYASTAGDLAGTRVKSTGELAEVTSSWRWLSRPPVQACWIDGDEDTLAPNTAAGTVNGVAADRPSAGKKPDYIAYTGERCCRRENMLAEHCWISTAPRVTKGPHADVYSLAGSSCYKPAKRRCKAQRQLR